MKAKVEELEKRLAISDNEIYRLKEIIKETEEARDHLENKYRSLETTIKLEKKKKKKKDRKLKGKTRRIQK